MSLSVFFLFLLYALVFFGVKIDGESGDDPVFGWALHSGKGNNYTIERELCRDSINFKRDDNGDPLEATCSFGAKQFWTVYLTIYAFVVSIIPVWLVLQPRDFINSHQLKFCMCLMVLGLLVKGPSLDADAIRAETSPAADEQAPIFPMLFTTIACGSVSGFHGLVSSGVTSKQLHKMRDSRAIGYCGMMGESALSALVIIICCSSGYWKGKYEKWPVSWGSAFIPGAGSLLEALGIGEKESSAIITVLVVSFAATTLDSGMRIQRVLIGELGEIVEKQVPVLGRALKNVYVAGLCSAVPACMLANSRIVDSLWNLFGATNQLVACLSLITVAIYVWRYHKFNMLYVLPFVLPIVWLGVFISWALGRQLVQYLDPNVRPDKVIDWLTTVPSYPSIIIAFAIAIFVLALLAESVWYFVSRRYLTDAPISQATGKVLGASGSTSAKQLTNLGCC